MPCACNTGKFVVRWTDAEGKPREESVATRVEASSMARRNDGTYQKVA